MPSFPFVLRGWSIFTVNPGVSEKNRIHHGFSRDIDHSAAHRGLKWSIFTVNPGVSEKNRVRHGFSGDIDHMESSAPTLAKILTTQTSDFASREIRE